MRTWSLSHLSYLLNVDIASRVKKSLENVNLSPRGNWMMYLSWLPEQFKIILATFSFCSCRQPDLERRATCPRVFICLHLHHKEGTFKKSTHTFQSSRLLNFDYTYSDPLCRASFDTHSLLTFTTSALNKNLGTSNSVIPLKSEIQYAFWWK